MKSYTKICLSLLSFGVALASHATFFFTQDNDDLFLVNEGSFNQTTGSFSRSGDDSVQGVVGSFETQSLVNVGDFVRATFSWSGGGSNNSGEQVVWGFFGGGEVTEDAQTSVTDGWAGYFHQIATRTSSGNVNFGVYRQGEGSQPLVDHVAGNADVNGAGGTPGNPRPPLQQNITSSGTVTLERISETQLQFTTLYQTLNDDTAASGTVGGIPYSVTVENGWATLQSTHNVADGPTDITGIVLAGRANFTLTDVQITNIPEPSTLALVGISGLAAFFASRRRKS